MKAVGLIAEYNPFHKGHKYHMEKARELAEADYVVVVMSGDWVQRGAPAVINKYLRASMALQEGADLVLELPVCYAVGSAEYFARGAVSLLSRLGVVDSLCFGCESGDSPLFTQTAGILAREPEDYRCLLRSALSRGSTFPAARRDALLACCPLPGMQDFLNAPNNILGIEYCKALLLEQSQLCPLPLQRKGRGYHETALEGSSFCSASAIRSALLSPSWGADDRKQALSSKLTPTALELLVQAQARGEIIGESDLSPYLSYRLLLETAKTLVSYQDISPDIASRILKSRNQFRSFQQFCSLLKTKDTTYTRISRGLLHILLNITREQTDQFRDNGYVFYGRILGLRKNSSALLKGVKKAGSLPLISKLADGPAQLDDVGRQMLALDIFAANLYETIKAQKSGGDFLPEQSQQIILL